WRVGGAGAHAPLGWGLTAAGREWYGWFFRETRGHSGRRHVVRGVEGAGTRRQCISPRAPDNGASRRIPPGGLRTESHQADRVSSRTGRSPATRKHQMITPLPRLAPRPVRDKMTFRSPTAYASLLDLGRLPAGDLVGFPTVSSGRRTGLHAAGLLHAGPDGHVGQARARRR